MELAKALIFLLLNFLAAPMDLEELIRSNVNACNAVLRANACAVQEIVLDMPCEIPLNSRK